MDRQTSNGRVNLCHGPLVPELLLFSAPILISGIIQLCFNIADMVVVGRYASVAALGAVGGATQLVYLLFTLSTGFSIGANVVVAKCFGSGDDTGMGRAAHTAITLALICGLTLASLVFAFAPRLLALTKVPADVLDASGIYLRIVCLGMPFSVLFNFAASILRAIGDTRSPLYYLAFAGVVNVVLNLVFVIGFHLDVAGVAIATAITNLISCTLTMRKLMVTRDSCRISLRRLGIDWAMCREIVRIGFPAGVQGSLYTFANLIIQTGVNSFGSLAMAGNTAASSIEGVIFIGLGAFDQTTTTSVGQNAGARKFGRIVKSFLYCTAYMALYVLVVGGFFFVFAKESVSFFNADPTAVSFGVARLRLMSLGYILDGIMINITSVLRGLGHALFPAAVTLAGAFFFRLFWVFYVFPHHRTIFFLFLCMPISWIGISLVNGTKLRHVLAALRKSHMR